MPVPGAEPGLMELQVVHLGDKWPPCHQVTASTQPQYFPAHVVFLLPGNGKHTGKENSGLLLGKERKSPVSAVTCPVLPCPLSTERAPSEGEVIDG